MVDIKLKVVEIKKQVDKIIENLGNELKDPVFRDNYLKIGIQKYKTKEERIIFEALITFYDTEKFINKYKYYHKDITKLADYYHTTSGIVMFYIRLIEYINKEDKV